MKYTRTNLVGEEETFEGDIEDIILLMGLLDDDINFEDYFYMERDDDDY